MCLMVKMDGFKIRSERRIKTKEEREQEEETRRNRESKTSKYLHVHEAES